MKFIIRNISYWDRVFFELINRYRDNRLLSRVIPWVSRSGDGWYYPFVVVLLLFTHPGQAFAFLGVALASFASELPVYKLVKNMVKRDRPFVKLPGILNRVVPPDQFSFPSGHTAGASVMAVVLSHFFPIITLPIYAWASLVGFSRVYLGVHYPSDILAGFGLGWASAQMGIFLLT
jgi:undecaprenyl-diphosphatase